VNYYPLTLLQLYKQDSQQRLQRQPRFDKKQNNQFGKAAVNFDITNALIADYFNSNKSRYYAWFASLAME
jgi:aspartokinase/homoserine dehydrogenase 1